MPTQGQILSNPISGDTFEYLQTANDTNGERVVLKASIKSKGQIVPRHIHVLQDETFEVLSGELFIWLDGKTSTLSAGEKMTLPKNKPHNHYNNGDVTVTYIHSMTPALDFDYLIETLVGLSADGKGKNGKFGLIQELVGVKYLDSKTYLADIPLVIQKILINTIAPIGRLLGYRAIYKKYSGIEK